MERWIRRIAAVFSGRRKQRRELQLVRIEELELRGMVVLVELGTRSARCRSAADLLLSCHAPRTLLAIARHASERALPVDHWVISGLDESGMAPDEAAQFAAALASECPAGAAVVSPGDEGSPFWARFGLHVDRCLALDAA